MASQPERPDEKLTAYGATGTNSVIEKSPAQFDSSAGSVQLRKEIDPGHRLSDQFEFLWFTQSNNQGLGEFALGARSLERILLPRSSRNVGGLSKHDGRRRIHHP